MSAVKPPRAPAGLGRAGRRAWRAFCSDFEMSAAELTVLDRLCRVTDVLAELDRQAADALEGGDVPLWGSVVRECRLQQVALVRLISVLKFPTDVEEE